MNKKYKHFNNENCKCKSNVTHKLSDLKNYVGLDSSSLLRIRKSKGNTPVDLKNKKIKNIKRENT